MCEPSTSESVNKITPPYRNFFVSSYFVFCFKPNICFKFFISSFANNCFGVASRTFNNLPFNGNTPYLSLPIISNPLIAKDFAESPSVNINLHSLDLFVPANLASSNFTKFFKLTFFLPSLFSNSANCLTCAI